LIVALVVAALLTSDVPPLRWGGDAEGGAPFVEADPSDPTNVRGFDVEVAEEIARGLGRRPVFVQVAFASIDQSVARGDFDIGLSGVEDTPARRAAVAATIPYYEFREVLTVREEDQNRFRTMDDLKGRRVATLGGTIAYDILINAPAVTAVSYDDDVHPYEDLRAGRVDAVLLDNVIAARAMRRTAGLHTHDEAVAVGHYIGVLAKENAALRDQVDAILRARMADGTLERIYRRWGIWDEHQVGFFARVLGGAGWVARAPTRRSTIDNVVAYVPALLRAAGITILLSFAGMALAVAVGLVVASGRVYGGPVTRALLTAYVELFRGTPLLLQLFVLYYGLSAVIRLPALLAAVVGLGLNYGAYESEIYRSAMTAVPRGQLDAARTLGFSAWQTFRLVRAPQALRLALAPMTNDFVALLKDSSLVSVITVVELTKQTSIFATNIGSWAVPGAICALLYLMMSLPLARLARRLENRWRVSAA
jgi:polar amino acid transport system substrate-binding protein